jgi:hypothetical protein
MPVNSNDAYSHSFKEKVMRRNLLCAMVLGLAFVVFALPARATDTASFQGNCTSGTLSCTFDAGRPSPGSQCATGIAEYAWSFGDTPVGWYYTAFSTISHTYSSGGAYQVDLKVYCWDGNVPTATNYVCFSYSFMGCITPGNGWLP